MSDSYVDISALRFNAYHNLRRKCEEILAEEKAAAIAQRERMRWIFGVEVYGGVMVMDAANSIYFERDDSL